MLKLTTFHRRSLQIGVCLTFLTHSHVQAQTAPASEVAPPSDNQGLVKDREPLPLWELGASAFALTQQAYPGSDTYVNRALAVPYFLYRGEHFRVDRGNTGYRAVKTPQFEFDIGFAGAFGSSSDKVEARRGMEKLGSLIEFGPRFKWNISNPEANGRWRFELPARAVFDISNQFKRRGYTIEPEIEFERRAFGGWRYSTGLSAVWGNQQFADTFYQVKPNQVLIDRPAYQAKKGLIAWRLSGFISHSYTNDFRVFAGVRVDSVIGAANEDSPLVKRKTAPSLLLGMTYTWMRSDRTEFD
ncbi:MipA/OmpV family protein [Undibacterium fentianense]|uniref:MipA/OmpV family protein n=1 Tax=Undibacterium fentianense TaxID=2828728 RepID=A0A941E544_9BURK|nr:MipA/OmpV family protein [Undibacterium fentianense]MBR7800789.1 MipA/OmpV family protein [Undibacterium fentianense]